MVNLFFILEGWRDHSCSKVGPTLFLLTFTYSIVSGQFSESQGSSPLSTVVKTQSGL